MYKTFKMNLAGRDLICYIDRVCAQSNGAVLMQYGDTMVLSTATASDKHVDVKDKPEKILNTVALDSVTQTHSGIKSDTVTIAVILLVYLFSPSSIVFNPLPPPITTTFGPCSYIFLLKIKELILTFFLPVILSSVASINNSMVLLFK